jgi:sarcosine oxidase delta subunit
MYALPRKQTFASFYQLVGAGEYLRRNCEAKHLRCLEVDHEFEFGGLLDRQICRSRAVEYLIHVFSRPTPNGSEIGSIRQEPANLWKHPKGIHRWQSIARRKFDDQLTMVYQLAVWKDD